MRLHTVFKRLLLMTITILCVFMASCTQAQKEDIWEKEGKSKAFNQTSTGIDLTLYNRTASYNVDALSGDYYTSALWAISKANNISSRLTIGTIASTSDFNFNTYSSADSMNGYNTLSYLPTSGYIFQSTIMLNRHYLGGFTLNGKKHIAIHELGHTLGLKDLNVSVLQGYTVMWFNYGSSSTTFTDYQEFDKANIVWKYGS